MHVKISNGMLIKNCIHVKKKAESFFVSSDGRYLSSQEAARMPNFSLASPEGSVARDVCTNALTQSSVFR